MQIYIKFANCENIIYLCNGVVPLDNSEIINIIGGASRITLLREAEIIPFEPDPVSTGVVKIRPMKRQLRIGLAALLAAVPSCALASEHSEKSDSVINLRDIEVVANRAGIRTPIAFSNFSKADIESANDGRDIPFMLSSLPSIVTTGDAGGGVGYSSIRVRGTDASRINITANGIPINDSESHNVYWVNMPDLASSLRDIQVQRGAGTSTNGAGAFGASINMITDTPADEQSAEVVASYGSYNANRQTVKINSGLFGQHWNVDARFSHIGSDGYIDRATSQLWSYHGQLAYTGESTSARLIAFGGKEKTYMAWDYASKEDMEKYGRTYNPCGEYIASDGSIAYYDDQCDNFVQHHMQLLIGQKLGPNWRLNLALHYTKGDGYYNQYKTDRTLVEYGLTPFLNANGELVEESDLIRLKNNDNDFGGGIFALNYESSGLRATLGGGMNWHHGRHFGQIDWVRNYVGPIDPLQLYYDNTGRKFDSNVYLRADYLLADGLSAYADMQYRHIRYSIRGVSDNYDWNIEGPAQLDVLRRYDFFNPKFGLTYLAGNHRAYASWSVAHKEPVRDNFTDGDPLHYPSSERLFDYEAGYSYTSKLFTVGANLYFMDYKDQLVVTGQLSDTGNPLSINVPDSYRMGIELQGTLRPLTWLDWDMNATISRNRIKNFTEYIYEGEWTNPITFDRGSTPIAFSPDLIFNTALKFHHSGFDASLSGQYISSQYMNNAKSEEAKLNSYFVSNLQLGYTFRNIPSVKSLHLGLTIYNLFNEKYFNNGYAGAGYYVDGGEKVIYRYAGYAAQAPTNFIAKVALSF